MKSWTLRKRIIFGFAAVNILVLAMGGYSLSRLHTIKRHADEIVDAGLPGVIHLGDLCECNGGRRQKK